MTTYIDGDSVNSQVTQIDDTDSPYTTTGESVILVDTSTAAVTVTLSTSDATASDPERRILILDVGDNASTNNITVNTEGAETIDPGDASSKTIDLDSGWLFVQSDGSNWFMSLNPIIEALTAGSATLTSATIDSLTTGSDTITDFTGTGLSVSGNALTADTVAAIDDTDSPYTTQGEDVILVDTSSAAVTVTLASADTVEGREIEIRDVSENAATNAITVNTEGGETIDPGDASSKTIDVDGASMDVVSDGSNWFSKRNAHLETLRVGSDTITDFTGAGLSVTGGTLDSSSFVSAIIDDTDSPYTTQNEDVVYANTSNGAVTVTLATSDATDANEIDVVNVDGSNDVTVNTEGSETIDPGAVSSKPISYPGRKVSFTSDGSDWDTGFETELNPHFGDGSDGSITRSSSANENGVIQATDYTIQNGVTMTVTSGTLIVLATQSITIKGTIDGNGQGGSGGSGGGSSSDGSAGGAGAFVPQSTGGSGGSGGGDAGDGGNGGNGDNGSEISFVTMLPAGLQMLAEGLNDLPAGAGGGGGGGATNVGDNLNGSNGSAPGGGGGGAQSDALGSGGAGGAGGATIILVAPSIAGPGTVQSDGADGSTGGTGSGGGGGGSGGLVVFVGGSVDLSSMTTSAAKGTGAAGQSDGGTGNSGGDGADGVAGTVETLEYP